MNSEAWDTSQRHTHYVLECYVHVNAMYHQHEKLHVQSIAQYCRTNQH
jgi:hypothetical protein